MSGSLSYDRTLDVYVQSDEIYIGTGYTPGGSNSTTECGDDCNDGLTPSTPLKTLQGVYKKFGKEADGYTVIVHLMGGSSSDPVDSPGNGRLYRTRNVYTGVGESWRCNFIYRGPRAMHKASGIVNFVSAQDVLTDGKPTGRTLLKFDSPITGEKYFLRWQRNDGREVTFPIPISENHPNGWVYTEVANAAALNYARDVGGGNKCYEAVPAVLIHCDDGDRKMHGVNYSGQAAFRMGDRQGTLGGFQDLDQNPLPLFERIMFGRSTWMILGSYYVDTCTFADNFWLKYGEMIPRGCNVEGFVHWQGDGGHRTFSHQHLETEAPAGRMLRYSSSSLEAQRYTGQSDPDNATLGMNLCVCAQNSHMTIGHDLGGKGGTFRVLKGLSVVHPSNGIGIKIYGSDSCLYVDNSARLVVSLVTGSNTGIWAVDGARARLNDVFPGNSAAGVFITGSDRHLRVGKGDPITQADFKDPSKWDGNFTRRLESSGSFAKDDDSRIWNKSWEPPGYGSY